MPLVEIVPSKYTRADIPNATRDLLVTKLVFNCYFNRFTFFRMTEVGQKPVVLSREIEGFALNRIQYAILNEVNLKFSMI